MSKTKNNIKNILGPIFLIVVFCCFNASYSHATVARLINYQGKLTNASGWAVTDGNYDMRFKIYDAATDGSLLWTGTHTAANGNAVVASRGIFSILLGSGSNNALNLDFISDTYYLQVEIYNTNTSQWEVFNNRKRIGAVPQAINSLNIVGDGYVDIDNTSAIQDAMNINYNPTSGSNDAVEIAYGSAGGSGAALKVIQSGTGYAATFTGGNVGIGNTNPTALLGLGASTTNRASLNIAAGTAPTGGDLHDGDLWYEAGHLYFRDTSTKDILAGGGGGPFTDGTDITYITDTANEDFAVGASTLVAPFSVDEENNTVRVGDGAGTNGKINMYASDGDTGSITYSTDDTWAFEGGRVAIGANAISDGASSERMLQVGSETSRGNLATYGEVISKGLNRHTALANIKDIYVYDTTGDSDGGRWIDWATTDNLSWYSETLDDGPNDPCDIDTEDRCYNSPFPRKAILVVTTDALYIFDAATNDMWMKFDQDTSGNCATGPCALGANTDNDPSSVTALNGVIYVGTNGASADGVNGLYAIDFVNDRMWFYGGTNRSAANKGISERNTAVNYNVDSDVKLEISPVGTISSEWVQWERVNDVHAMVMSRTQSAVTALGSATNTNPGYGKVFVAIATDAGVTVINISARVLNQYSDAGYDDYTAVALTSRGFLYALNATSDQLERWDTIDTDKASEVAGTYSRRWNASNSLPALASSAFQIVAGAPDNLEVAERASNNLNTEDVIYVGHSLGMAELHDHTTQAFGWVKYYNKTRQTPMMMLAGINDMVLPMDDATGTQAQDLSYANTDMAIKGTPTLGVDGVQGKAMNFDNTDDYLCSDANQENTCDVDGAFNMSTVGWTISLWFKHSTTAPSSSIDTIFEKCVTAAPGQATGCVIAYMNTSGQIVVANDTDATWTRPDGGGAPSYNITATSTYAYNDNQWHQLVITRTNANDVDSWIDAQGMTLSTATGGTTGFDNNQIVTIGASCSTTTGVDCAAANALNFWDGQIDDVQFVVGTTTQATMTQLYVRRLYNVERPRASKKTINVDNATSATSTSLTDTGESWFVNEFAGLIVEITGSDDADCVGVTRRVSSNTATALTFTPAVPAACTLNDTADFEINPETLFGSSDSVAGIGITAETPLGEARQLCIGTNSGDDLGGVTCYNHQDGPSIVADVYHSQASKKDDSDTDWTGNNYDDMKAIDLSTRTLVMASEGHFTSVTEDVRLGQGLDYISNQLYAIRQEIVLDGITAVGSTGSEVGFTGGADLAEYYKSAEPLEAGMIVATGDDGADTVKKTTGAYQKDVLGIVSTAPGIILGTQEENAYPIALSGRVPVNMTTENGRIVKGDQVTSSSLPGYGMVAIDTGRVIGTVLEDVDQNSWADCPFDLGLPAGIKCGQIMVFVNLTDFTGVTIEDLMTKESYGEATTNPDFENVLNNMTKEEILEGENNPVIRSEWTDIFRATSTLGFMKKLNDPTAISKINSEILAKNINATGSVVSPLIVADTIVAKHIKAESIEGLEFIQTGMQETQDGVASNKTEVRNLGQQIADLESSLKTLADKSNGLNWGEFKELATGEGLAVGGPAKFNGPAVFKAMVEFIDNVIFRNNVEFAGEVIFNRDMAGYAVIKEGSDNVDVKFEKEYSSTPIISVSLSLQQIKDEEVRKATEELLLISDIKYIITNATAKGFKVKIDQKAVSDVPFSWHAMEVKDAKIFLSNDEEKEIIDNIHDDINEKNKSAENIPSLVEISLSGETSEIKKIAETEAAQETPVQ